MPTTKIDLVNAGLALMGAEPLTSLTEESAQAQAVSLVYDRIYEAALTSHSWRFASAKVSLSQLVAKPLNEWTYAYQLPADFLVAQFVDVGDYEIYEDKVYSDQKTLILDYIFKPGEEKLPPYFTKALIYQIAADLAVAVTEQTTRADFFAALATEAWRFARNRDSQARPPRAWSDDDQFVTARF